MTFRHAGIRSTMAEFLFVHISRKMKRSFLKNGINNIHIVFIAIDNDLARSLQNKRSERGKGEMKTVSKMSIRGMKRCGV